MGGWPRWSAKPADWMRSCDPVINFVHAAPSLPMLDSSAREIAEQRFLLTGKRLIRDCGWRHWSRPESSFLWGIELGGHHLDEGADGSQALGKRCVSCVLDLCRREQRALKEWQSAGVSDVATRKSRQDDFRCDTIPFAGALSHRSPCKPKIDHAIQVARQVARIETNRGPHRNPLSHRCFPMLPTQYDIVLI
jgi:hypothetical protein